MHGSRHSASGSSGDPLLKAVTWANGQIVDLGALGGNQSFTQSVNNRGQVVGWALDLVPTIDDNIWQYYYPAPFATRQRAAVWNNGVAMDLGTLGGPSAWATDINDNGQIIGQSFTSVASGTPHQANGFPFVRPMAGFIWQNGAMTNLGTLDGTWLLPTRINGQGQVIGYGTVAGDNSFHPFLWERGVLRDLGTFGGTSGLASAINETGEVCGEAALATGANRAFLWRNGVMMNLGTLGQKSRALAINSKSQVVGGSGIDLSNSRAFLSENGSPMLDLNALVPSGSPHLADGLGINDRGEILCGGANSKGLFLLIPAPQLTIRRSSASSGSDIAIDMQVISGRHYSLEASADLRSWTSLGTEFTAQTDAVTREIPTAQGTQFYRLTVLP